MYDRIVRGIRVCESEDPQDLVDLESIDGLRVDRKFTDAFLLRRKVAEKICAAQNALPNGYRFLVYEAFRPRSRQILLWDAVLVQLRSEHPDWADPDYIVEAEKFVANPHGFGSGHQSAAAVDITLIDAAGREVDMGTGVQEFCPKTRTESPLISDAQRAARHVLRDALQAQGVINYPDEWWHFSHGDRLWAEVLGRGEAFFAPLDADGENQR